MILEEDGELTMVENEVFQSASSQPAGGNCESYKYDEIVVEILLIILQTS